MRSPLDDRDPGGHLERQEYARRRDAAFEARVVRRTLRHFGSRTGRPPWCAPAGSTPAGPP
jgi:hypothetical protein